VRLGEGTELDLGDPRLDAAHATLREQALVENGSLCAAGVSAYTRVVEARRAGLCELLEGWSPDDHDEVRRMLDRLSRAFVAEIPPARAV
jgi:hypothetical protein